MSLQPTDDGASPTPAVVFVHGLFSSASTWSAMTAVLASDPDVLGVDVHWYEYPSPKWRGRLRRIPDFDALADGLRTYLNVQVRPRQPVILVGHSQGGLVITRLLSRMLSDDERDGLRRISAVVLYACPNHGSNYALALRGAAIFWRHPQERALRALDPGVAEARRRVRVQLSTPGGEVHVPIVAVAGLEDAVVSPASAGGDWGEVETVPGTHSSLIDVQSLRDTAYQLLKVRIVAAAVGAAAHNPGRFAAVENSTDDQWRQIVVELSARLSLDEWDTGVGSMLRLPYRIAAEDYDRMLDLLHWLQVRTHPPGNSEMQRVFLTLFDVLADWVRTLEKHLDSTQDHSLLQIERWYRAGGFNPKYHEDLAAYRVYTSLVQDLTLELTRVVNWYCDEVRAAFDSGFRLIEGEVSVEGGPYSNGDTAVLVPRYSLKDLEQQPTPYVDLETFKQLRYSRDHHTPRPE
ncbi:hypothetical protein GCM10027446_30270 [Angustibacter peucedani]